MLHVTETSFAWINQSLLAPSQAFCKFFPFWWILRRVVHVWGWRIVDGPCLRGTDSWIVLVWTINDWELFLSGKPCATRRFVLNEWQYLLTISHSVYIAAGWQLKISKMIKFWSFSLASLTMSGFMLYPTVTVWESELPRHMSEK